LESVCQSNPDGATGTSVRILATRQTIVRAGLHLPPGRGRIPTQGRRRRVLERVSVEFLVASQACECDRLQKALLEVTVSVGEPVLADDLVAKEDVDMIEPVTREYLKSGSPLDHDVMSVDLRSQRVGLAPGIGRRQMGAIEHELDVVSGAQVAR